MITINCDTCGVEIERGQWAIDNYKHHFCSNKCKDIYSARDQIKSYCLECNVEILNHPSIIRKFCSNECNLKYIGEHKNTVNKICKWCGKTFTVRKDFVKNGGGKLCSRECACEYRKEKHGLYSNCEVCGKEMRYTKSDIKKYCSYECSGIARSGENNYGWKGGITPEYSLIRHSDEYNQFRKGVLKRDNYTCQLCGDTKSNILRVHHIKSFSRFPELRFYIDNGITLCESCHDKFHNLYGKLIFTSDDFYEFQTQTKGLYL